MARMTVSLPDDLADMVKEKQRAHGYATPDAAAAALIEQGLAATASEDHSAGRTDEQLWRLLDQGEASGPAKAWDAAAVRAEVLRRYRASTAA